MRFYNEKKQPYLETDASGARFRAAMLQGIDRIQFPKDKVPETSDLQPIACASKCLSSLVI